ncbi:MAG: tol-pal system protein YbgF [Burkholderiales bacterium]|nr:tol-pal system protein YbgF [Burkholderiales bacterium]
MTGRHGLGLGRLVAVLALCGASLGAQAGLFDDEEARRAIVDLRTKLDAVQLQGDTRNTELKQNITDANVALSAELTSKITTQLTQQMTEQFDQLRRSLLELNNQLELMRGDLAKLRGQDELQQQGIRDLSKEGAELQRKNTDQLAAFEARLLRLEPQKLSLDGREVTVEAEEKKSYDDAVALLRNNDFAGAIAGLTTFTRRYPASPFAAHASYWLATAHYSKGDLKDAMSGYRSVVASYPDHPRAAEAMLALANCQAESKDVKGARKTLEELVRTYPNTEAAAAGRDRIAMLR